MALRKYFKLCKKDAVDMPLPDLSGSLSKELDSSVIKAANDEVTAAIENSSRKQSVYLKLGNKQRAEICNTAQCNSSFCK